MSSHTGSDRSGQPRNRENQLPWRTSRHVEQFPDPPSSTALQGARLYPVGGTLANEPQQPDQEFQEFRPRETQLQQLQQELRARQELFQQDIRARQERLQQLQQRPRARGDQETGTLEIQLARINADFAHRDVQLARRDVQCARGHLTFVYQSTPYGIAMGLLTAGRQEESLRERMENLQRLTSKLAEETRHLLKLRTSLIRSSLTERETGTHRTSRAYGDWRVSNVGRPGQPQATTMDRYPQAPLYREVRTPPPNYEEAVASGRASTTREQQ